MKWHRIAALTHARNIEFVRDRSALGWNLLLPVMLVLGLGFVFSGEGRPLAKVGVLQADTAGEGHPALEVRYVDYVSVDELDPAVTKVERHQLDMLIDLEQSRYWVNESSPKGYLLGRIVDGLDGEHTLRRAQVSGDATRYVDWLVPGILGMNMMFSCLFGVGYVIVRYRKNGYLKRLGATPVAAAEFMTAQVTSRLILIMVVTVGVYLGTDWLLDFRMRGSHALLFVVALAGAASMTAMGLMISARVASEELAGGLLNLVSWPMMVVSGVWFSIEGSPAAIQWLAAAFPLTHLLDAARAVMLDGDGLLDIADHLLVLGAMTIGFLVTGSLMFRWRDR